MGSCTSCTGINNPFPVPYIEPDTNNEYPGLQIRTSVTGQPAKPFKDNWGWVALECIPVIGIVVSVKLIKNIDDTPLNSFGIVLTERADEKQKLRHAKAMRLNCFLLLVTGIALMAIGLAAGGGFGNHNIIANTGLALTISLSLGFIGSWYFVNHLRRRVLIDPSQLSLDPMF